MCLYCRIQRRRQGGLRGTNICLSTYLNDMTFDCRLLTNLFPVYRNEVFEDVVKRCTYGQLGQMWLLPGHLFLTTKSRLKVFSFDFIPASRQQISDTGPLGFYYQSMPSPILEVLDPAIYPNTVFVVQRSGHVQCWKFDEEYTWSVYAEFDVCNATAGAEVVSVCMDPAHKCIYWCERRAATDSATYCVCKRTLPDDLAKVKSKDIGPVHALVHNCPPSDVYVITNNILISSRPVDGSVHFILWLSINKQSVTMFVAGEKLETDLSPLPSVDFRTVLVQCLPVIAKTGQYSGRVYVQLDPQRGQMVALQEDGKLYRYHTVDDNSDVVTCTMTQFPDLSDVELEADNWFLTQTVFGIRTGSKLRLFNARLGLPLRDVTSPDSGEILGVSVSHIPTVMVGFFTQHDIYIVQKNSAKGDSLSMMSAPAGRTFQTDSLQVAYLSQEKQQDQSAHVVKRISHLHRRWKGDQVKQPRSRLSQLVDPYMAEFWRLEELVGSLADRSKLPVNTEATTVEEEVRNILFNKSSLPLDVQQAQILWLCEKYPDVMLQVLTGDLQYETDDLATDQADRWQRLLGLEADTTPSGDTTLLLFEHVCRLLYKLKPQNLMQFVRAAQSISEQTVGVSAFVRRKQTFQYYKKALSCLPEPDTSLDIEAAVRVKVNLILASCEGHDTERAIKLLLEHQQWKTAITLIKEQPDNSQSRACLLFITMAALAQQQVLSEYAKDIFSLVPSCQSFLTFSDIIEKQPEVKQSQLTMSASAVFCQGPPDIPVGSIRPILQQVLSADNKC
ncbi:uncharacterized protein LOC124292529 [Haliotis rubra]|uniref:uncharacterized protein LOC124292529 n=1 Tax=Haliotis rubra TaxID=36100 RepID=UPI001EE610C8|nr:uncharacterized protein LOC124292529 [Haliotis rubra]